MNASSPRKPANAGDPAGASVPPASGDGVGASAAGEGAAPGRPAHPGRDASGAAVGESVERVIGEGVTFPVISEQVQVGTVSERSGTVRVRKVVHQVSEPVSAQGYREVIETLRVPRNQVVQAVQQPWQQGDALVVPVYEERLVRQLVLLEELHVTRRREPLDSGASASLRREEVIVERLDPQTRQWVPEQP